ncbi:MAG: ABC transporter substrate-binding protein [Candidatus Competibacteraceae bacterium]|nr:ABC transporter substrate-binding protein [Candidatus Competibacteraceae bacterium]
MNLRKGILLGLGILGSVSLAGPLQAATLAISCGAVGQELELCKQGAEAWAEQTGNEVRLISTPNSSSERLALYQQLLAAGASDIDVFQIDVVWPGILANHLIDLTPYAEAGVIEEHFQAIVENNTVDGKLVAIPWFTDAGILYYRSDLLEKYNENPPTTWEELERIAQTIQEAERAEGQDRLWGFVWQGRAYEGLTCNALEWIASHNGGTIVADDGEITINNPQAVEAISKAAGWVGAISPEGVLNYTEEEARGVFQSGNAVFMRNWPYAWGLAQGEDSPIKDKVGVVALPKGGQEGRHAGTLGGWQLAVSRYSENPELAADLVMYLASIEEQKRRAIEGTYNPTIKSLYEDEEVLEAVPFFGDLYDTFVNAVARPSSVTGNKYNQVSQEFWNTVHSVLSGQAQADSALADLERDLMRLSRGGRW